MILRSLHMLTHLIIYLYETQYNYYPHVTGMKAEARITAGNWKT